MARVISLLIPALKETLFMVSFATFFSIIIGTPLGILLVITREKNIMENSILHSILSYIVNMGRSFPFVILMISIIPFTRLLIGTSVGTKAAIVPLTIATIPFYSRIIESALLEVDWGIVEASQAMGATTWQIIYKVLIPESMSSIILGVTITLVNVIGYSAMAGAVGGGGLGHLAISYGYHRFDNEVMLWTVLLLIIVVQIIQTTGNLLSKKINRG